MNQGTDMELLKTSEIARRLNFSVRTIYEWAEQGLIPHYKIQHELRFDWTEVRQWLRTRRRGDG